MSALANSARQIALEQPLAPKRFLVFCSHTVTSPTAGYARHIAGRTELSPTAFSQSVHNASAGLYTIITNSKTPVCSVSRARATFACAWLEAQGFLFEHPDERVC